MSEQLGGKVRIAARHEHPDVRLNHGFHRRDGHGARHRWRHARRSRSTHWQHPAAPRQRHQCPRWQSHTNTFQSMLQRTPCAGDVLVPGRPQEVVRMIMTLIWRVIGALGYSVRRPDHVDDNLLAHGHSSVFGAAAEQRHQ